MLERVYLEITNVCNLNCTFCHKTSREKRLMTENEFEELTSKLEGKVKYMFFHLMGEPTLHPLLPRFIQKAKEKGFLPVITTNGSLLSQKGDELLLTPPHKISISLHAPEANEAFAVNNYLPSCIDFAKKASRSGAFVALRLWNLGTDADNSWILDFLHSEFPDPWTDIRGGAGQRLATRIFLEWGEHFEWPDNSLPECDTDTDMFCHGLRNQVGVLVDGTVVPCCLDADGSLALGNLFENSLDEILSSPRAKSIYDGFTRRRAVESMCRKCGYARRFSKERSDE